MSDCSCLERSLSDSLPAEGERLAFVFLAFRRQPDIPMIRYEAMATSRAFLRIAGAVVMGGHVSTPKTNSESNCEGIRIAGRYNQSEAQKRMSAATWASQRSSIFVVTVLTPATT